MLSDDLKEITIQGIRARPKTKEGKLHHLLFTIDYYLSKNDANNIKKLNLELKKPENKLSLELTTKYNDTLIKLDKFYNKKDDKGFWEYSIFQKKIIPNEEQNIKMGLKPENTFNLKKIDHYLNPQKSKEELIEVQYKLDKKLSSKDLIIYNKYIENKKVDLEKDLNEIKLLGVKAQPKTTEGKLYYIMFLLDTFIKKNQVDNIANIYLKLKDSKYTLSTDMLEENKLLLNTMNSIVDNINLIELQFTKFYNQMPPLNEKGFNKFDDWQIDTIKNIDNNISTIVSAPTSAGKSVLSGYTVSKGKSLYIVPTDALAWQVGAYIGGIINKDIPIVTLTYQSIPKRDQFIKLLNSSSAIVGTPEQILDILPFINCDFKWIIFDEIHMMGKKEGAAMEMIAKILNNIPFLGLTATIGNIDELKEWFTSLYSKPIENIICNKRFFNLQKYFFDSKLNELVMLNPLSMTSINEFSDGSILNKTLNQTPQDTWSLANKLLLNNIDLGDLNPYKYFDKNELIELSKTYKYFDELIKFMVNNYDKYKVEISKILNEYSSYNFTNHDINLPILIEKLKNENKFPAIIFQQNTIACLELVRKLSEDLDNIENVKYPNLKKDRMQKEKNDKRENKKLEKELNTMTEKQLDKKLKDNKDFIFELKIENDVNAPHNDFIYNIEDKFTDNDIKEWANKYKQFFPCINGDYHYLIKLLWRGIGVYTHGLPDGYLRLVQKLASKKKLAIVISDSSLVFGISMPFRSSVIYNNSIAKDNLDSMLYHQMAGRAGRRGLDKEGNVIFVGYSWERIKELSISEIPFVEGANKVIWTYGQAYNISLNNNYLDINKKLFKNIFSLNYVNNFDKLIENNFKDIWSDCYEKDKNLIQLMWMFRYSNECIIINILLPYLKKYFDNVNPNEENKQIEIAYFLSKFINIKNLDLIERLPELLSSKINYEIIYEDLKNKNIDVERSVNGQVWISIRNNCLVDIKNDILRQELFDFSTKLKAIQHYCYHTKQVNLTKLLGKLLTRIWWIYHSSSPVMRSFDREFLQLCIEADD